MKTILLLTFALACKVAYSQPDPTMPKEPGKCYGKVKTGERYIDTTSYIYYPVKEEYKSKRLKEEERNLYLSPERELVIQSVDPSNGTVIWKKEIEEAEKFTFQTVKKLKRAKRYKLDTLVIQIIGYNFPGRWTECVCESLITKELYQAIMDVLVAEGFAPASNDVPFTDGFREKLRTGLLSYQSHYNLGQGALSIETIEHMKIKVKYK